MSIIENITSILTANNINVNIVNISINQNYLI